MEKTEPDGLVRFGVFELDSRSGELRSRGSRVKLQGPASPGLASCVGKARASRHPRGTARQTVACRHVCGFRPWAERGGETRDALGDTAENPRYIETLPRHGYRFIAAAVPDALPPERSDTSLKQ